jgi:DNA-binding transcriptional regulator YiaG
MIRRKKPSRKQLVDAIYIMVRCWDRSKDHDDLAAQFGAHVEDLRDMVRHEVIAPNELTEAVRKLRGHFGETQQQFAARVNSAIITVARWETTRPPSGKSLEQLLAIARSEALTECSNLFEQALAGNIESPDPAVASDELFENKRAKWKTEK